MGYRNKTYVIFDGDEDIWAYGFMRGWNKNENMEFSFYDAHDLRPMSGTASEAYVKRVLIARRKIPRRTACEPACRLNLDRCQDGVDLVPALSGTVCVLLDHMSVLLARAESGGFIAKSRQLREVWRWFA